MRKSILKKHVQWAEKWINSRWPEMQRMTESDYEAILAQNDTTWPAYIGPAGQSIIFFKNSLIDGLIFAPTSGEFLELKWMPETYREFAESLDGFLKKNSLCIDDDGVVFNAKEMKHAICFVDSIEETEPTHPHPKKYKNLKYVVFSDDTKQPRHRINRHLSLQRKITNSGGLTCGYFTYQGFTNGTFSKDLFYPIKFGFSGYFFEDQYHIWDFNVEALPF
jgi:hypothetical protein